MNLTRHPLTFDVVSDRYEYLAITDTGGTDDPSDENIDDYMGKVDAAIEAVVGKEVQAEAMLEDWSSDTVEVGYWIESQSADDADAFARRIAKRIGATLLYVLEDDMMTELDIRNPRRY